MNYLFFIEGNDIYINEYINKCIYILLMYWQNKKISKQINK